MRFFILFCIFWAVELTAQDAAWQAACSQMPVVHAGPELTGTNCAQTLLASFASTPAVKALIILPKATDHLHFHRAWRCAWTKTAPSLLDAIQILTNHTPIRATFRPPFLLLEAESDLTTPLVQSRHYETALAVESKSSPKPATYADSSWQHLQPVSKKSLSIQVLPALNTDAWWHFYRAYFAAGKLSGREWIEALCLATRTTAVITRNRVTFTLDPRNAPLAVDPPTVQAARLDGSDTDCLNLLAGELVRGCRVPVSGDRTFYTPDGHGHYRALWTRDFAYMLISAGDWLVPSEVQACLETLIQGIRSDGAAPDRVEPGGRAIYVAGSPNQPLGEPNLDNPQFLVLAVDAYLKRIPKTRALGLLGTWSDRLHRSLAYLPLDAQGLIYNDPQKVHSPYGFTDTVRKTGTLCMESLLLWEACCRLAEWDRAAGKPVLAASLRRQAERIQTGLGALWDEDASAFLAASQDCRQLDIWATAYAVEIGFPLGPKRARVLRFLVDHYQDFVWHGQVRHLLNGQYWASLLTPVEHGRYQNGAYWATASGWVMAALAEVRPTLAKQMFTELMADFKQTGACECVNDGYRQLPSYVVSATNPLAAARQLRY